MKSRILYLILVILLNYSCKKLSYQAEPAPLSFMGINKIAATGTGNYIVSWQKPSEVEIDFYEVYMQSILTASEQPQLGLASQISRSLHDNLGLTEEFATENGIMIELNDGDAPVVKGKVLGVAKGENTSFEVPALDPGNYGFQVRAVAKDGRRDANTKVILFSVLAKPSFEGLQSAEIDGDIIILKWNPFVTTETGSEIYYTVFEGEAFSNALKITKETRAEISTVGKVPGSLWTYGVRVTDPSGRMDANSVQKTVTIPEDTSDYLGCLEGEAMGATSIEVTFEWPEKGADKVTIYRNGANIFSTSDKDVTTFVDIGLLEGVTYEYRCEASILESKKVGLNVLSLKTLSTNPPNFSGIANVTVIDAHSVKVSWGVATGVPVHRYRIYGKLGNSVDWTAETMAEAGSNALESTITNLGDELPYSFGVRACSEKGICDENVKTIKVTMSDGGAPLTIGATGATIVNGDLIITAPWKHQDGAVSKRRIYLKINGGISQKISDYSLVKSVSVDNPLDPVQELVYGNLQEKKDYFIIVRDEDAQGNVSSNLNVFTLNTGDLTPPSFTGITSLSLGPAGRKENTLVVGFTAIDSEIVNPNGASHYQVYVKTGVTDACSLGTLFKEFTASPYNKAQSYEYLLEGLQPRTTYSVCLKARDTASNVSDTSSYLVKSTLDTTPPIFDGIQELTYDASTALMRVKWNASLSADILEYKVKIWKNDPTPDEGDILTVKKAHAQFKTGFYFDRNLFSFGSNDTVYVLVEACDDAGYIPSGTQNCSIAPETSALWVVLADIDPPPGFAGIASEGAQGTPSEGTISVTWIAPAVWTDYRGFKVYYYNTENNELSFLKNCPCSQAGCPEMPTSCDVTGLDPYRTYQLHVRAYDEAQNHTLLDPLSYSTPKRATDTTPPSYVSNLALDFSDATSHLTWATGTDNQYAAEPGAVITYKLYRKANTTFGSATNPNIDGDLIASSTSTIHDDNQGLLSGVTYYYAVCAYDASDNKACDGNIKNVTTPDLIPPVLTDFVTSKTAEDKSWNLTWNMSDNMSPTLLVKLRVAYSDEPNGPVTNADSTIVSGYDITQINNLVGPKNMDKYVNYLLTVEDETGNKTTAYLSVFSQNKITVTSVQSNEGSVLGGKYIVIKGDGFHSSSVVKLGTDACQNLQVISKTILFCQSPPKTAGAYDVEVSNSDGSAEKLMAGYTYCVENSTCTHLCNNPSSWATNFADGIGTAGDPYIICNGTHLDNIRYFGHGKTFEFGDNVDLSSFTGNSFAPLSTYSNGYFYAFINGKNYAVANYTYKNPAQDGVGLIGWFIAGYDISNLGLINFDIEGKNYVGGLIGYSQYASTGSISNVFATGTIKGAVYVGGIIGHGPIGLFNAYSLANVSGIRLVGGVAGAKWYSGSGLFSKGNVIAAGDTNAECRVGGLVGEWNGNGQTLESVYSMGNVTCSNINDNNARYTGGLFGVASNITCQECYATGKITGSTYVGGISGSASISYQGSYFTGEVEGSYYIGGVAGVFNGANVMNESYNAGKVLGHISTTGGLIGQASNGTTITSSYNTGDVNLDRTQAGAGYDFGGLIGYAYISNIDSSYSTGKVTLVQGTIGRIGGLIGRAHRSSVKNSYSNSEVNALDATSWVGGFIGYMDGNAETDFQNNYATGNVSGNSQVGGFGGYCQAGATETVRNNYATGAVLGQDEVGGFCSRIVNGTVDVDFALNYAIGPVTGRNTVGGFVSYLDSAITIEKNFATGSVTGEDFVGGFAGRLYYHTVTVRQCYAKGNVDASTYAGGFIGYQPYRYDATHLNSFTDLYSTGNVTALDYFGGFAGSTVDVVSRVYSTGQVIRKISGAGTRGGLLGLLYKQNGVNDLPDSFWDQETSGLSTSAAGKPKSTELMKQRATYTNWDFDTIWQIDEGNGYPKFIWQN